MSLQKCKEGTDMKKTLLTLAIFCGLAFSYGTPFVNAEPLDAETINKALAEAKKYNTPDASWMYSGEHNNVVYRDVSLIVPTVKINRDGPIVQLPSKPNAKIAQLKVDAFEGATVDQLFDQYHINQAVVYSKGNIVYERYRDGFDGNTQHLVQSVSKTVTAMFVLDLITDGNLKENGLVTDYVPQLKGTLYDGATIRNLLDMSVGLATGDNYGAHDNLNTHVKAMQMSTGYSEFSKGKEDLDFIDFLKKYNTGTKPMMHHGDTAWLYSSQNTDLLGHIAEKVTNRKWADLFQEKAYKHIGANNDSTMIYSLSGYGGFDGGFSISPKDMIRLVIAYTKGSLRNSPYSKDTFQNLDKIPESVISPKKITHPEMLEFISLANDQLGISHYRNYTYIGTNNLNGHRLYYAFGVFGTCVVWSMDSDVVIVTTGTYNPSSMKANIAALSAAYVIEANL